MTTYHFIVTEEARTDLAFYTAFERKVITTAIRAQLAYQPLLETRNRKPLRANLLAAWELRVGKYRVFYKVDDTAHEVTVVAVGHKEHNVLLIRGREVEI